MRSIRGRRWIPLALIGAGLSGAACGADDSALDLKPAAEPAPASAAAKSMRLFGELAVGRLGQRYDLGTQSTRRASIDFTWDGRPAPQWRAVLSDRLDNFHPASSGERSTLNSLREAYVGWQDEEARNAVDVGRVNARYGPAYGFNPTDFLRDGSVRSVSSADPLAQRENRLGTAMVRLQRLWGGGSMSLAVAPKLSDAPSRESFSADWGATNHADRVLAAWSLQPSDRVSAQAFAMHERRKGWQWGANGTVLLGDATVAFAEWAGGRDADLLSEAFDANPRLVNRSRWVAGATYTTTTKLSITAEVEYNGFALDRARWQQAVATSGADALEGYLVHVQRRQDIASRKAAMVYASQKDAAVKNLDVTGLVRYNAVDHSRFVWAEARYHLPKVDVAVQWQGNFGRATTEFGANSTRNLVQLLVAAYF